MERQVIQFASHNTTAQERLIRLFHTKCPASLSSIRWPLMQGHSILLVQLNVP